MSWPGIDETHDPALVSWVESANGHPDFPVQNLPFGMFSPDGDAPPRIGVAIGDSIFDIGQPGDLADLFQRSPAERLALRRALSRALSDPGQKAALAPRIHRADACRMHLPFAVGDYTDFYAGIHHARNVGALFRPDNPLLPNYRHVPIGYHGRASSIRPSGEAVRRPDGQFRGADDDHPGFGPCRRLDYELELGIWIGTGNRLGEPIPIDRAATHVAGFCLLNDWSARDLQAWEYQPLGPFLAKNFHSTISCWVVTAEALAPFRVAQPLRPDGDPAPLPYLLDAGDQRQGAFSIALEVAIRSARMAADGHAPFTVGRSHATDLYWTVAQLVAHHSVNGCNLRPGDLLGSGTISGPTPDACGSLLEATQGGKTPIRLPTGEMRTFLEDGDTVFLSGRMEAEGRVPIGFGACEATVVGVAGAPQA